MVRLLFSVPENVEGEGCRTQCWRIDPHRAMHWVPKHISLGEDDPFEWSIHQFLA
jgi:hypothetical protein